MSLLIIIIIILFIICIFNIIMNLRIKEKYKMSINKVLEYEKIIDEQGKKNHEYNNQLMILKGYIDNKNKLKEYLETIIDDHRTGQNYEIRQLSKIPSNGLKELLYYKIAKMDKYNIKYYIYVSENIRESIDKFDVNTIQDITKIFGVFIDNSIEAANESTKKEIDLDFKQDREYLIISITNTVNNIKKLDNIGENRYTTKGKGHGFGLSIVKDIVKKNNKIETLSEQDEDKFTQIIMIDTKEKIKRMSK